jgi:hypothetical protein
MEVFLVYNGFLVKRRVRGLAYEKINGAHKKCQNCDKLKYS